MDTDLIKHDWTSDKKPEIYQSVVHSCIEGQLVRKNAFSTGANTTFLDEIMSMCQVGLFLREIRFQISKIGNWMYHFLRGIFWNCRFRDGWMKALEHILVQGPVELQLITLQCSILTGPKKAQCSKKSFKNEQKIREIIPFLPKKLKNLIWFFFQKEWVRKDHRSDEIFL